MGVLTKQVRVMLNGVQVEMFTNLIGYDPTSPNYWNTVIGTPAQPQSKYIYAYYISAATGAGTGAQPINTLNTVKAPYNPRLLFGSQTIAALTNAFNASTTTLNNGAGTDGANPSATDYIGTVSSLGVATGLQLFLNTTAIPINLLCVPSVSSPSVVQAILTVCETRAFPSHRLA
jgi:hypothetical protein